MRYEIGDKIILRNTLKHGDTVCYLTYTDDMKSMKTNAIEIFAIEGHSYILYREGGLWLVNDFMIDHEKTAKLYVPQNFLMNNTKAGTLDASKLWGKRGHKMNIEEIRESLKKYDANKEEKDSLVGRDIRNDILINRRRIESEKLCLLLKEAIDTHIKNLNEENDKIKGELEL